MTIYEKSILENLPFQKYQVNKWFNEFAYSIERVGGELSICFRFEGEEETKEVSSCHVLGKTSNEGIFDWKVSLFVRTFTLLED